MCCQPLATEIIDIVHSFVGNNRRLSFAADPLTLFPDGRTDISVQPGLVLVVDRRRIQTLKDPSLDVAANVVVHIRITDRAALDGFFDLEQEARQQLALASG